MYEICTRRPKYEVRPFRPFDIFSDFERQFFSGGGLIPYRTDIKDEGSKVIIESELPGFDKSEIDINIEGDILTISASHEESSEEKDEQANYILKERRSGLFKRSFDISNIDSEKIEAKYENGILSLDMPKKGDEAPVSKRLEIA